MGLSVGCETNGVPLSMLLDAMVDIPALAVDDVDCSVVDSVDGTE